MQWWKNDRILSFAPLGKPMGCLLLVALSIQALSAQALATFLKPEHGDILVANVSNSTDNMNPGKYLLQATPKQDANATWSTTWREYPAAGPGGLEYIEVYFGPVRSNYSEVFWRALPEVSLPADLIKRFDGKAVSVSHCLT